MTSQIQSTPVDAGPAAPEHDIFPSAETAGHGQSARPGPGRAVIVVEGLVKAYGSTRAVDGLSLSVEAGEVFAILGPNGAGKTTTLEILEGYRGPDAGTVRVLGLNPWRDGARLKARTGVMLQQDGLHPGLSAREVLRLYAGFFARPLDPVRLLDQVGLSDAAATRCRRLSGGQKRRLALAVALIGRPELVFLDEPTTGMDPQARLATWDIVRGLRDDGTTVVLTTHFMDEAERLADRVAIVDRGRLVALDSPRGLMHGEARTATTVRLTAPAGLDTTALALLPGVAAVHEGPPGTYAFETGDPAALLVEVTAWLRDRGVTLDELRVGHGSLEEAFLRLTGPQEEQV